MFEKIRLGYRPIIAFRALQTIARDPDDTVAVVRFVQAFSGRSAFRMHRRFQRHPVGAKILHERRVLLDSLDVGKLARLPRGTLGHAYAEWMNESRLEVNGMQSAAQVTGIGVKVEAPEVIFVSQRVRDMHDLWHVVLGYDRDLLGEAAIISFTNAQLRIPALAVLVWGTLAQPERSAEDKELIREAQRRGRRAEWFPAQDWEALLDQPLDEVRRALRVGPPPEYARRHTRGSERFAAA